MRRILYVNDLHKKAVDPPSITGYVQCNIMLQKDIMHLITELGVDTLIEGGDWYDRGYVSDVPASLADVEMDREMRSLLNGEFYGVIGNHIKLKMDSNPELFLIQPHDTLKTRRHVPRDYQVIKTPDILRVGTVQISFLHCGIGRDKLSDFRPIRQDWATYHIALFHTPYIIPNQQLAQCGLHVNTYTNGQIADTLHGVDLAICADIHRPLGSFNVSSDTWTTRMIVPGSIMNTSSAEADIHRTINLPLITIDDDSKVTLEFVPFNLRTNMLQFKTTTMSSTQREKLDGIRAKRKRDIYSNGDTISAADLLKPEAFTFIGMMSRLNYSQVDKEMILAVIENPLNVAGIVNIYKSSKEVPEL